MSITELINAYYSNNTEFHSAKPLKRLSMSLSENSSESLEEDNDASKRRRSSTKDARDRKKFITQPKMQEVHEEDEEDEISIIE